MNETTLELFDLSGKIAIVTGATGTLGGEMARGLARAGAKVGILGRRERRAVEVVADIEREGGEAVALVADVLDREGQEVAKSIGEAARFLKLDVTSETDWQAAIAAAEHEFGKVDILVNNAGISGTYQPDTTSTEAWDRVMDINVKGALHAAQACLPAMLARGYGRIVFSSSITGPITGQPGFAHSGISRNRRRSAGGQSSGQSAVSQRSVSGQSK